MGAHPATQQVTDEEKTPQNEVTNLTDLEGTPTEMSLREHNILYWSIALFIGLALAVILLLMLKRKRP